MDLEMMRDAGGEGKVGLASVPGQFNLEERIRGIEDAFAVAGGGMEVVTVVDDQNDDSEDDVVVAKLNNQAH
jgi:ABC-type sugar transport system substrate-binding protein